MRLTEQTFFPMFFLRHSFHWWSQAKIPRTGVVGTRGQSRRGPEELNTCENNFSNRNYLCLWIPSPNSLVPRDLQMCISWSGPRNAVDETKVH
jgi:hypothetical protein